MQGPRSEIRLAIQLDFRLCGCCSVEYLKEGAPRVPGVPSNGRHHQQKKGEKGAYG